jgi:ribonuclease VapC
MIAVDSSALFAVLLQEAWAAECADVLRIEADLAISAGTMVETLIVAEGKGVGDQMRAFVESFDFEVVPVTAETVRLALEGFRRFGKGRHPAKLNYGDCFSYAAAKYLGCPLLFVGDDFNRTDLTSVL